MLPRAIAIVGVAWLVCLAGCASRSVISPELASQVDLGVTFAEIKDAPDHYHGRMVMWGGEVLSARLGQEGTRIEVLELPLNDRQAPIYDRTKSEGRFLAFQRQFLDPATLPKGTRVTIIGTVTGVVRQPLDETEYDYPTLDLQHVTVWPKEDRRARYPGPYPYPYGYPYWGGRWGPWGPYPYYPYWW